MLYKSVNSFHLHHVLLLVQTYDTPNSRPVFCVQMYVYADAVAERDSLETCPRPLACSWKTPVCQVWDVATAKGVKWPLWAEVLRTSEARRKGQHWLSCCDNTIIFKWNAQSLAPPAPLPPPFWQTSHPSRVDSHAILSFMLPYSFLFLFLWTLSHIMP